MINENCILEMNRKDEVNIWMHGEKKSIYLQSKLNSADEDSNQTKKQIQCNTVDHNYEESCSKSAEISESINIKDGNILTLDKSMYAFFLNVYLRNCT